MGRDIYDTSNVIGNGNGNIRNGIIQNNLRQCAIKRHSASYLQDQSVSMIINSPDADILGKDARESLYLTDIQVLTELGSGCHLVAERHGDINGD